MLIPFKELFDRHHITSTTCLHLGANYGQEREQYAAVGLARVVWVEALPDVCAQLKENVVGYARHHVLCACLSDVNNKHVEFNVANNEFQSSSLLALGTHRQEHPSVKFMHSIKMTTIRCDALLIAHRIEIEEHSFLNIDLQGAELMALRGMGDDLLKRFDHAYIEVNEKHLYVGCPLVAEVDAFMEEHGFLGKEVKMMKAGWGDKYYARKQCSLL